MTHTLKTGQLNFENNNHKGSFSCVVIKGGKFHNLKPEFKKQIIDALEYEEPEIKLEDMF